MHKTKHIFKYVVKSGVGGILQARHFLIRIYLLKPASKGANVAIRLLGTAGGGRKRFIFKMDPRTFLHFRNSSPEPQLQVRKAARKFPQPVIAQSLM